jgi:acyl-CoA synthetase (AMP-forming)/AMP-acid ligase II
MSSRSNLAAAAEHPLFARTADDLLFSSLQRHAREQPDRVAIARCQTSGRFQTTTFAELLTQANGYAERFIEHTPPASVVPLLLGRTETCVAAALGALIAGRALCCVNPKLRLPQIERVLSDTGARFAMLDGAGLFALKGGVPAQSMAARTHWAVVRDASYSRLSQSIQAELATAARVEVWEPASGQAVEDCALRDPDSVGACLFTSGSTGTPKGVLIGYSDLLERARAEVELYSLDRSDVLLNLLPFSFDVGLNQLLSAVIAGAELVLLDSWLPADVARAAAQRGVTGISAVPSLWADFMRAGVAFDRKGQHRSLRYVTVSGGDLSPAQHARLPAVVDGAGVFKTYGQTEAFRATALRPEDYLERPLSVGRPFAGVRLYVVREDGSPAEPGEVGEVVHTGLGVMLGYADGSDPEHKLKPNPFRGSLDPNPFAIHTGDLGSFDDAGYLFLRGRRDDLVKCNGNRVYPNEVRNQLATLSGVASAEVVVLRTEDQSRLAGFVVPKQGVEVDANRLRLELVKRVPSYMVPEVLVIKDELPLTASGKPDRPSLAHEAKAQLARLGASFAGVLELGLLERLAML